MTSVPEDEDLRVAARAELSADEARVGSDDPEAQAEAILDESDARTAGAPAVEHRHSEDTVEPLD
jgi:hypothetical protein